MKLVVSEYRQKFWYLLIMISFFVFGEQVRRGIDGRLSFNLIFVFSMVVLVFLNLKRLDIFKTCLIILLAFHATLINDFNNASINTMLKCVVQLYLPLLLLAINHTQQFDYLNVSRACIKLFNIFILLIFSIYIFDMLTNGIIMRILSEHLLYTVENWMPDEIYFFSDRYPSYMGHFLYTGELYLIFFVINACYNFKTKKWLINQKLLYVVYIIGTLSTGSKTCAVLMIFVIMITILRGRNKTINLIVILGAFAAIYSMGAFDVVIDRIVGEDNGLTTGRADAWEFLNSRGLLQMSLLNGKGMNLEYIWQDAVSTSSIGYTAERYASIALEYPVLANFFRFGIVNNLLMVFLMIVQPFIKLYRSDNKYIALCAFSIFVDINTFNLLTQGMDAMIVYVFAIMLLEFISNIEVSKHK